LQKKQLKIVKAKHAGFCFGVKRAIGIAEDTLSKKTKACSIGSIIHNPAVVNDLSKKGLRVISDIKDAKGQDLVIRSHGVAPRLRRQAKELGIKTVDATCPFVKRSHDIVTSLRREGYHIVIVGEKDHPEVKALAEVAADACSILTKEKDIKRLKIRNSKIGVIAQTTLSRDQFLKIASSCLGMGRFEYRIFDTICNDVVQRQKEAKRIAKNADLIIVVGGRVSANTKHLAKMCKETGALTQHIEDESEIKSTWLKNRFSVGVISGASTPAEIVDRVVKKLKSF